MNYPRKPATAPGTEVNGSFTYQYLQFVFETLPTLGEEDDLEALLPWRWKETLPRLIHGAALKIKMASGFLL